MRLLRNASAILTFLVFLGRAYQHLFWDVPFRALLWKETLLAPRLQQWFQMSWQDYLSTWGSDAVIESAMTGFGLFYLFCGLVTLLVWKKPKWVRPVWLTGSFSLLGLAILATMEYNASTITLFEYTLGWTTPLFAWALWQERILWPQIKFGIMLAIALTFVSHGLLAMGVVPVPAHFIEMTTLILPLDMAGARIFLFVAGVLDLICSIALFIKPIQRPALLYMAFWGFITAFARVWAYVEPFNFCWDMHMWAFETVIRLIHGAWPLLLWLSFHKKFETRTFHV